MPEDLRPSSLEALPDPVHPAATLVDPVRKVGRTWTLWASPDTGLVSGRRARMSLLTIIEA